jgi:hypothetical protein
METGPKPLIAFIVLAACVAAEHPATAAPMKIKADFTLPDPTSSIDGITVAQKFDQFFSYSAGLLDQWQSGGLISPSFGDYQFATGTGLIAILPYTGAGGASNPAPFADPVVQSPSSSEFHGSWDTNNANTVGALKSFLNTNYNSNVPVFYFDHNEVGNNNDDGAGLPNKALLAYGSVQIVDNVTGAVVRTWCFDDSTTCTGAAAPVVSVGEVALTGTSGTVYDVSANKGSGKPDFFLFAPDMDLGLYDPADIFRININLTHLSDGFEELGIVGAKFVSEVPEPGT